MTILVIQNYDLAPLGVIEDCISERNISTDIVIPTKQKLLPTYPRNYSGLIILGGPMSAQDDESHPHLLDTIQIIQSFARQKKPILGICLGAQLIARAFGQRVYPNNVIELGFMPLNLVQPAVWNDPLLKSALESKEDFICLMQWHYDTFDLPPQAELLLTSSSCRNQIYRLHGNIYGFQCHLEVTPPILEAWVNAWSDYLQKEHPGFLSKLPIQINMYLDQSRHFAYRVFHSWLDLI